MTNTEHVAITKFYRNGADYLRLRIIQDGDCESPRSYDNGSIFITRESAWESPDPRDQIPDVLSSAVSWWSSGPNHWVRPYRAGRIIRYARAYLPDQVYAIAALDRAGADDALVLDFDPEGRSWHDGLAIVTKESWKAVMGQDSLPCGGAPGPNGGKTYPSARDLLEQDLDLYNQWQRGECFGYLIERAVVGGWEEIDSCWGMIGPPDGYVLSQALEQLPPEAEEIDALPETRSPVNPEQLTPAQLYVVELQGLIAGFEFELCDECGRDLEEHVIARDPLGNPHAWCSTAATELVRVIDDQMVDTMRQELAAVAAARSSDDQLEALKSALQCALTRWPETDQPADPAIAGPAQPKGP